jgi:outer membrane receptor protein involved in Fe transport
VASIARGEETDTTRWTCKLRPHSTLAIFLVGWSLCAFIIPAAGLRAQPTGSLTGVIVDAGTDAPLEGVTVRLLELERRTETDATGEFVFTEIPAGRFTLRYELPSYPSVAEHVAITAGEDGLLRIRLLRVDAVLDELIVMAERASANAGTSESVISGFGGNARTAADLLAEQVPGVQVIRNSGSAVGGARVQLRGVSSLTLSNAPAIYVDGILVSSRHGSLGTGASSELHILEQIPASSVERIRVLRGPAAAAAYPNAFSGVIVIETRKGPRAN